MHISLLIIAVLAVFLAEAEAAPTSKRQPGLITVPIRSIHGYDRRGLHPQLYLQQHINRGERRIARMTGRAVPSTVELRDKLHKRMYIVGNNPILPGRLPGAKAPQSKRFLPATSMIDAFKATMAKYLKSKPQANPNAHSTTNKGAAAALKLDVTPQTNVSPLDIEAAMNGGLTLANAPTKGDSIALNIEAADTGYVGQVQLGTPPKNFQILMDSGSADFWVGSENCTEEGTTSDCGPHQFLGPKSSSSFVDSGAPFSVSYGTGEVSGTIITDDVVMAGLQLKGHTFGTSNVESIQFTSSDVAFDGLMGLAQSGLSQQGVATPVESLAAANLIPAPITSYKISRLADQKNDGEVTFGGLDNTKFDSNTLVAFPNVNKQGFWEGDLQAVTVNNKDTGLQGRTAILDTGTTVVIAPPADAAAVHQLIQGAASDGQGGFTVPCTMTESVALTFGGRSFSIDPRDIAFLPVDPNNLNGNCTSGIGAGNVGGANEWLVGDVFLKNAYFSTDVAKNTISLAKLV